jgi:hypothetical protein
MAQIVKENQIISKDSKPSDKFIHDIQSYSVAVAALAACVNIRSAHARNHPVPH